MIKSMTAFARAEQQFDWGVLSWEIKTVNHRYLEISPRLPDDMRVLEPQVRELIGSGLKRGKVECNCRLKLIVEDQALVINEPFVRNFISTIKQLDNLTPNPGRINPLELMKWPGVLQVPETNWEAIRAAALAMLAQVIGELQQARDREGEKLKEFIKMRTEEIAGLVTSLRAQIPQINQRQREKMANRVAELQVNLDRDRLEQEVALLLQKIDVAEELDRLAMHTQEVDRMLNSTQPVGRRLDFQLQELNREANTLGSKSVDMESTRTAVDLKVLIEQIREQVQNIE